MTAGSCVQLVHRDLNLSAKTLFMCYVGEGISNDLGPTNGKNASQALYKVTLRLWASALLARMLLFCVITSKTENTIYRKFQ